MMNAWKKGCYPAIVARMERSEMREVRSEEPSRISLRSMRATIPMFCLLLTSCTLGPNFHRPAAPPVNTYTTGKPPTSTVSAATTAGQKQHFRNGKAIAAEWWEVFHSKPLNELIIAALKANPDLRAADAALRIAHENTLSQRAAYFPSINGNFNPTRQLTAGTLQSNLASNAYLYNLNTLQLNISYAPGVLGMNRRLVESLMAQEEAIRFQREAVYLTLTSNVVLAAIGEASLREQIKATERQIAIAAKLWKIMQQQHTLGQIGEEGVAAQKALLAQTQATLPPLQNQLIQQRHLMAVLCGHFPSEQFTQRFTLRSLTLPTELPVSLPSTLVEQRPDIRAAEALMHAASANVGVAIINRLPNIVLTGYGGSDALTIATIFAGNTNMWGAAANIAGTVFDAGNLLHKQRAAVAAYKQTRDQYRSIVLSAFQDVADTLSAIQADARTLKAATTQMQAASRSLFIAKRQWKAGAVGYLPVLNAEQIYQQSLITLALSQANRFADTAALFQALGGGWCPGFVPHARS